MKTIYKTIVSAIITSHNGKILLVLDESGIYRGCWHNLGGSVEDGKKYEQILLEKILSSTGLDLSRYPLEQLDYIGGASQNTDSSNEIATYVIKFIYFKVHINDRDSSEFLIKPINKSRRVEWFDLSDLSKLKLTPPGIILYKKLGYL